MKRTDLEHRQPSPTTPPDPGPDPGQAQKENPDLLAQDGVSGGGIEALPERLKRYGKAKKSALDVIDYMEEHPAPHLAHVLKAMKTCGDYLVFRHYYTVDHVKLHGARLCHKHLLCNLCAIRRGAKTLAAYLERWDTIRAAHPRLRPYLVTLTVKDGEDLAERWEHLHKAQRELWKQRARGRGSVLDPVKGAVWSYEIKRGTGSGLWHPHLHMVALAEHMEPENYRAGTLGDLSQAWHRITGDSFMVDVRPIEGDPVEGFMEVFKYAVKFADQTPADTVHAYEVLTGRRLIASAGLFRGVPEPTTLLDDDGALSDLPFVTYFMRYLKGSGYVRT